MKIKNPIYFQQSLVALLLLLSGCANSLDQTEPNFDLKGYGLMRLGDQMHEHGDDDGAMEFYARSIQRAPGDIETRVKLAALLETHNDVQDAADQYHTLTQLAPDNAEYHRAYGRLLIRQGHAAEAKDEYETSLRLEPEDSRGLNGFGVALDLLGDHESAQRQYRHVLEAKPDDPVTLNNLGHSLILAGSYEDAIHLLEPVADSASAPAALRMNLAEAYALAGMDVDAERVLRRDMPAAKVKKAVADFHAKRGKAVPALLYAALGNFGTPAFATARLDSVREQLGNETGLTFEVVPEVDEAGGTPLFKARASGFRDAAAAERFCSDLQKNNTACSVHGTD